MHFLMAIVLFFGVVTVIGNPDPTSSRWTVAALTENSAADAAGLELGDRIVSVDGNRFNTFDALSDYLRDNPGQEITLTVERDDRELTLATTLGTTNDRGEAVGFLGVGPEYPNVRVDPLTGAVESVQATGETIWLSIKGLGAFFSPDGISGYLDTLTGSDPAPVPGEIEGEGRIISVVGAVQLASQSPDIAGALYFLFAINVFIGVFNLVPLLPFDGGHVAIATYERIRSRKGKRHFADVAKLMPVTYAVVLLLAFVFISSLYLDIVNPISL
jgi:membrane-associated protease RseP (regulator of RpoE activity)